MNLKKLRSSELDGAIFGTLLGDASLNKTSLGGNYNLTFSHSPKQKEYLEFKKNIFSQLSDVEFKYKEIAYFNRQIQKVYKTCYYYTNYRKYFTKLAKIFYNENRVKIVTKRILEKLTPFGIALWWMDDGSYVVNEKYYIRKGVLATCSFTEEENKLILDYFKNTWKIEGKLTYSTNSSKKKYYTITFCGENLNKLVQLIDTFVIPSMQYKVGKAVYRG